jgi:hypothetical protein
VRYGRCRDIRLASDRNLTWELEKMSNQSKAQSHIRRRPSPVLWFLVHTFPSFDWLFLGSAFCQVLLSSSGHLPNLADRMCLLYCINRSWTCRLPPCSELRTSFTISHSQVFFLRLVELRFCGWRICHGVLRIGLSLIVRLQIMAVENTTSFGSVQSLRHVQLLGSLRYSRETPPQRQRTDTPRGELPKWEF